MTSLVQSTSVDSVDSPALSTHQAAQFIGVSYALLTHDRATGALGVPYVKIGDRVVYLKPRLMAWLEAHITIPTPAAEVAQTPALAVAQARRRGRPTKADQIARQRTLTQKNGGAV